MPHITPVNQIIKQPRLMRLQRPLLVPQKLRLRPALLSPGGRVAVVRVIGNRHVLGRFPQIGGEPGGVDPLALVVHEVLEMIGVPVLLRERKHDRGLADEDAALRRGCAPRAACGPAAMHTALRGPQLGIKLLS